MTAKCVLSNQNVNAQCIFMKHTSRWKSFVPRSNRHRCTNDNNEFGKVWRWFSRNSNTFSWVSLCSHHARIDYATV